MRLGNEINHGHFFSPRAFLHKLHPFETPAGSNFAGSTFLASLPPSLHRRRISLVSSPDFKYRRLDLSLANQYRGRFSGSAREGAPFSTLPMTVKGSEKSITPFVYRFNQRGFLDGEPYQIQSTRRRRLRTITQRSMSDTVLDSAIAIDRELQIRDQSRSSSCPDQVFARPMSDACDDC